MSGGKPVACDQLRSIVERIERMEDEKAGVTADIAEIYAEAKANGYEPKIIRKIIRLRKIDEADRSEEDAITETYMAALGMLPDFEPAAG